MKRAAALILFHVALVGCAGSAKYMREVPPTGHFVAPPDKALIVFARPSGLAFIQNFHILDQTGAWLGEAVAKSSFSVKLPPGEYLFVGWGQNTEALHATVGAGRTYYVRVQVRIPIAVVLVELEALKPGSAGLSELQNWLRDGRQLEPDPAGRIGNAALEDTVRVEDHDAADRVRRALGSWNEYSPAEKEERTLRVEDGIPSASVPLQ